MSRFRVAPALPVLAAALALTQGALPAPAGAAQDPPEPPLIQEAPARPPAPSPPATPEGTVPAPATPAPAPARTPAPPQAPLRPALDYLRWQEMSPRERQTFVEGAVVALGSLAVRLRADLALDGRVPPETLAAVVRLVDATYPTRAPLVYLREMESIYLTAEGQKLSMQDCFLQAFGRANGR